MQADEMKMHNEYIISWLELVLAGARLASLGQSVRVSGAGRRARARRSREACARTLERLSLTQPAESLHRIAFRLCDRGNYGVEGQANMRNH
jgi:hypothetical protein